MENSRLPQLQELVKPDEALVLSQPSDISAFSGFTCLVTSEREAFLLVRRHQITLIHASFSPTTDVFSGIELRAGCFPSQLLGHLQESAKESAITTLYIDGENLTYEEYYWLTQKGHFNVTSQNRDALWNLRIGKTPREKQAITQACSYTHRAVTTVLSQLQPGLTEKDVSTLLFLEMLKNGADSSLAFPTIVAFGPHSALPHHQPTTTALTENTPVLIDVGARVSGYCADMTRTVWFGNTPSPEFLKVQNVVTNAYQTAFDTLALAVKQGEPVQAKNVDSWARKVVTDNGYGTQFIHTTGHGVGLDIHEPPSLNWRNESELTTDTVITIEPGIYLPEKFGYRYENTVLVTKAGVTELTRSEQ